MVRETDWRGLGFSQDLQLRVALHVGPVYPTTDPITGLPKVTGTHVSRAARLEPLTPPGEIYASEAFAALAALSNIQEFTCEYVKRLDWAKRYGTFPTYVLRRRPEPTVEICHHRTI
jgi:class 3 adenylate cyclase